MNVLHSKTQLDTVLAVAAGLGTAAVLGWLWLLAPWVALLPVVAAGAALLAAALTWAALVPGWAGDGLWSLAGAAVITAEAAWEYFELPAGAVVFQALAWTPSVAAAVLLGRTGGWRRGLRVGLGTALLANAGLALVFGSWLGQPVQATVLEATWALTRFEASRSTDFLVWMVGDFWGATVVRLLSGAGLGAALGWAAERLPLFSDRSRKTSSRPGS